MGKENIYYKYLQTHCFVHLPMLIVSKLDLEVKQYLLCLAIQIVNMYLVLSLNLIMYLYYTKLYLIYSIYIYFVLVTIITYHSVLYWLTWEMLKV